jgi:transcriptional regulator with XRE-family HTH domain
MKKEIGARIRAARELAGVSRTRLADLLNVDASLVSRIESGDVGISAARLLTIAKLLDTRASVLLGEEPGPASKE